MNHENVKNKVHQLRMAREITQEELAEILGVTRQTIIAIEKENYTPSVLLALKVGEYFKQPIEQIFSYEK